MTHPQPTENAALLLRVARALVPILAGAAWAHSGKGWMFARADGAYATMHSAPLAAFDAARAA